MKRRFLAALFPGIVLLGAAAIAMSVGAVERWRHQTDVPPEMAFALPVVRVLDANHVQITRVYRATHYEVDGIRAAGIKTDRGIAIAMTVPDGEAARRTLDAITRSFGTRLRTVGRDGTILIAEAAVAAALPD